MVWNSLEIAQDLRDPRFRIDHGWIQGQGGTRGM